MPKNSRHTLGGDTAELSGVLYSQHFYWLLAGRAAPRAGTWITQRRVDRGHHDQWGGDRNIGQMVTFNHYYTIFYRPSRSQGAEYIHNGSYLSYPLFGN